MQQEKHTHLFFIQIIQGLEVLIYYSFTILNSRSKGHIDSGENYLMAQMNTMKTDILLQTIMGQIETIQTFTQTLVKKKKKKEKERNLQFLVSFLLEIGT